MSNNDVNYSSLIKYFPHLKLYIPPPISERNKHLSNLTGKWISGNYKELFKNDLWKKVSLVGPPLEKAKGVVYIAHTLRKDGDVKNMFKKAADILAKNDYLVLVPNPYQETPGLVYEQDKFLDIGHSDGIFAFIMSGNSRHQGSYTEVEISSAEFRVPAIVITMDKGTTRRHPFNKERDLVFVCYSRNWEEAYVKGLIVGNATIPLGKAKKLFLEKVILEEKKQEGSLEEKLADPKIEELDEDIENIKKKAKDYFGFDCLDSECTIVNGVKMKKYFIRKGICEDVHFDEPWKRANIKARKKKIKQAVSEYYKKREVEMPDSIYLFKYKRKSDD